MSRRERQIDFLLSAAACAAGLVLAEGVLRVAWRPEMEHTVIVAHPVYGWALRPGSRMHSVASDRGLDYHILVNSRGWRERERTPAPPPGTRRVLLLGDSIVFGTGVEVADRCSDRLEKALGPGVEVVNAGVSGWGTDQEFLWLCREGFGLRPDVVVLGLCVANDIVNDMLPHALFGTAPKPRFVFRAGRLELEPAAAAAPPPRSQQLSALLKHSRLLHFVGRHVQLLRARRRPARVAAGTAPYFPEDLESDASHWSVYRVPYTQRFEAAFAVTEAIVTAMRDSCAARGIRLVLLAFPQKVEVDAGERDRELRHYGYDPGQFDLAVPYARLQALADRLHVPWVYPLDAYLRAAARGPLFFACDGHPNAAGQALAAAALAPAVRAQLLPPRQEPHGLQHRDRVS